MHIKGSAQSQPQSKFNVDMINIPELLASDRFSDALAIIKKKIHHPSFSIESLENDLELNDYSEKDVTNLLFKIKFIKTEILQNHASESDYLLTQVCNILLKKLIERKACLVVGIPPEKINTIYDNSHLYRKFVAQQNKILNDMDAAYTKHNQQIAALKKLENHLYSGKKLITDNLHGLRIRHPESAKQIAYLSKILGDSEADAGDDTNPNTVRDTQGLTSPGTAAEEQISFQKMINLVHREIHALHPIEDQTISYFYKTLDQLIPNDLSCLLLDINKLDHLKDLKNWIANNIENIYTLHKLHSKANTTYQFQQKNHLFFNKNNNHIKKDSINHYINQNDYLCPSNSLFPARKGNKIIRLYSNAYDDKEKTKGLFADICHDIDNAKSDITLTAWALNVGSDLGMQDKRKLAERLKYAAFRGVKITILLWTNIVPNEKDDIPELKKMLKDITDPAVLNNIAIKKTSRMPGYSDHQKMLIVDSEKLYIGGMDLTLKREDPNKWHDAHTAISGPCVRDALKVIDAHWKAVSKVHCLSQSCFDKSDVNQRGIAHLEAAIEAAKIKNNQKQHEAKTTDENAEDNATMQIIVGMKRHAFNNPRKWKKTYGKATHTSELQRAHLELVANAKRFLYMENQNFSGQYSDTKSGNLVLNAIIEKIVEKYKEGKPFHFYCLLPIYHGNNEKEIPSKMLMIRQWNTIKWFIETINKLTDGNAGNYITFFSEVTPVTTGTLSHFEQKYTHSKLLIADDKEMIIGSANNTVRSLVGNRDSEVIIRMKGQRKQIEAYRIQLMEEHFNANNLTPSMKYEPEKIENVREIEKVLEKNLSDMQQDQSNENIYTTPWGNISKEHLMHGTRPPSIPANNPLPGQLIMKIPYTKRLLD